MRLIVCPLFHRKKHHQPVAGYRLFSPKEHHKARSVAFCIPVAASPPIFSYITGNLNKSNWILNHDIFSCVYNIIVWIRFEDSVLYYIDKNLFLFFIISFLVGQVNEQEFKVCFTKWTIPYTKSLVIFERGKFVKLDLRLIKTDFENSYTNRKLHCFWVS